MLALLNSKRLMMLTSVPAVCVSAAASKDGLCLYGPPSVALLKPLLPHDGEEVLQLSIVAAPMAVATATGEELRPHLTPQQVSMQSVPQDVCRRNAPEKKGRW